ncbi:MAG: helix-turn-helix domain-containing protein [Geodermatophilaceae bacterium]|nr:helix-turn-helix domain-containing protein [Geodermatophilaceae bacterium]
MPPQRFLTLDDVAEILNISWSQAYALVRSKELSAIQIGGRNQWRVEITQLDAYIEGKYAEAAAVLDAEHSAEAAAGETSAATKRA